MVLTSEKNIIATSSAELFSAVLYRFWRALACSGVLWLALACIDVHLRALALTCSGVHWRALACIDVLLRALACSAMQNSSA